MKPETRLLLIILIIGLILRFLYLDTSYVFWDESIYLMQGNEIMGIPAGYTEFLWRPPLVSFIVVPFSLFSDYVMASKIIMVFLSSFLMLAAYHLGRETSPITGLLSSFIVAVHPQLIHMASWVMTGYSRGDFWLIFSLFLSPGPDATES